MNGCNGSGLVGCLFSRLLIDHTIFPSLLFLWGLVEGKLTTEEEFERVGAEAIEGRDPWYQWRDRLEIYLVVWITGKRSEDNSSTIPQHL